MFSMEQLLLRLEVHLLHLCCEQLGIYIWTLYTYTSFNERENFKTFIERRSASACYFFQKNCDGNHITTTAACWQLTIRVDRVDLD